MRVTRIYGHSVIIIIIEPLNGFEAPARPPVIGTNVVDHEFCISRMVITTGKRVDGARKRSWVGCSKAAIESEQNAVDNLDVHDLPPSVANRPDLVDDARLPALQAWLRGAAAIVVLMLVEDEIWLPNVGQAVLEVVA